MIRIHRRSLSAEAMTDLADYQAVVDGHATYAARVEAGKRHFDRRKKNAAFRTVRATLTQMCHGARRCM